MVECKEVWKEKYFINPLCGHEQTFVYATPYSCDNPHCKERVLEVDRLTSQAMRVKFFIEGKI